MPFSPETWAAMLAGVGRVLTDLPMARIILSLVSLSVMAPTQTGAGLKLMGRQVSGYVTWCVVYSLWISPLRKVPGPTLFAISELPLLVLTVSSDPHKKMLALHRRYGDVVRTGPRSVSCLHAAAWQEVYGHPSAGRQGGDENPHLPGFFDEARHGIIAADTAGHAHQRRILAPAFSAPAMRRQEPLIRGYVDLLFARLREQADRGAPVDLVRWFNYTTFDIIGALAFGAPFGMLERAGYHSWIANLLGFFHTQYALASFRRAYPRLEAMMTPLLKLSAARVISAHNAFVDERVGQRMALPASRPDFMDAMMAKDASGGPVRLRAKTSGTMGADMANSLPRNCRFPPFATTPVFCSWAAPRRRRRRK